VSRFTQAGRKPKSIFQVARHFYGEAFDVENHRDLADAMAEWSDMSAAERTFTLAHLSYLNLLALAGIQTLLNEILDTVDEVAEEFEGDRGEEVDDLEEDIEPGDDLEDDGEDVEINPDNGAGPPDGVTIPGPDMVFDAQPVDREMDPEGTALVIEPVSQDHDDIEPEEGA